MTNEQADDIINGVFTKADFANINSLINADIQTLKQHGNITYTSTDVNGLITETLTFTAFNTNNTFTRVTSYYKNDALYKAMQVLNKKLEKAIQLEDYRLAAKLKLQKEELLFNKD